MAVIDFPKAGDLGEELLPKRVDLVLFRGDSREFTFNIKDEQDQPVDLSSFDAEVHVKTTAAGVEGANITPNPTVDDTDFDTGVVKISFSPAQTIAYADAAAPQFVDGLIWEIEFRDLSGNVRTYLGGKVTVFEDIVRGVGD